MFVFPLHSRKLSFFYHIYVIFKIVHLYTDIRIVGKSNQALSIAQIPSVTLRSSSDYEKKNSLPPPLRNVGSFLNICGCHQNDRHTDLSRNKKKSSRMKNILPSAFSTISLAVQACYRIYNAFQCLHMCWHVLCVRERTCFFILRLFPFFLLEIFLKF